MAVSEASAREAPPRSSSKLRKPAPRAIAPSTPQHAPRRVYARRRPRRRGVRGRIRRRRGQRRIRRRRAGEATVHHGGRRIRRRWGDAAATRSATDSASARSSDSASAGSSDSAADSASAASARSSDSAADSASGRRGRKGTRTVAQARTEELFAAVRPRHRMLDGAENGFINALFKWLAENLARPPGRASSSSPFRSHGAASARARAVSRSPAGETPRTVRGQCIAPLTRCTSHCARAADCRRFATPRFFRS